MKYHALYLKVACLTLGVLCRSGVWGADLARENVGCGEICVQLLCAYHHLAFPKAAVRAKLRPGPHGETSLEEVKQALQLVGLSARAVKGDLDALRTTRSPLVLFVRQQRDDEIGHFAVAAWDPLHDRGLVCDPFAAPQPITVTASDIQRVWMGYALLVEPPALPSVFLGAGYLVLGLSSAVLGAIAEWVLFRRIGNLQGAHLEGS